MAINFPATPTLNQTYTYNGRTWTYNGVGWQATGSTGLTVYTKTNFTATAAQTTFSVTYTVGFVDVYYNGSKLSSSEYTATTGSTVVLGTACSVNDIVETIAWTISSSFNPSLGSASATSLAIGGATLGSNALAVTGTTQLNSALGVGMAPVNVLDITQTQNASSKIKLLNENTSTAAASELRLSNLTNNAQFLMYGTGFTTSGVSRQDGLLINSGAATGGITLNTGAAQPIYFAVNSTEVARFFTGGGLGINTTNQSLFTGAGFPILCGLSDTAGRLLRFGNSNFNGTSTGTFSKIEYSAGTGNAALTITNTISGGTANGAIVFSGSSEYARFDTSGNLGIGRSPAYKLHVSTGSATSVIASFTDSINLAYILTKKILVFSDFKSAAPKKPASALTEASLSAPRQTVGFWEMLALL